ncbi:uncharacterized protein H6S33_002111 [Morchella sextelata]|uniref:uncharacterized protein n=1 Tax=Morchella sextelata TaxID=1174677 RepID=UPI001D049EA1|nr:uncharacterized protein H6S33_002111 [Morchella sextelata]KAH0608059.1 hypothetical protein H6S33_002111 [Morchella sextelata]
MSDNNNNELAPHVVNHMHDLGMSPPPSDQTSPAEQPSSEGSNSGRFSLDFLKLGLGSRRKDGEKPKRRGPKPDSKPALTRRQELNRQAQRTHRERKESYTKNLEAETTRLAAEFTRIQKEKAAVVAENQRLHEETARLRAILEAHGIAYTPQTGYTMGPAVGQGVPPPEVARFGRTYNEIGIDFVLALEKPCMDHIQLMFGNIDKNPEADFHGHRLMVSCPPEPLYLKQHQQQQEQQQQQTHAEVPWGAQTWDLAANELWDLFNMQDRFELEGELTPIAVWVLVSQHPQFAYLDMNDFNSLAEGLLLKVKCHGFGAVIEEFEVQDSLASLFSKKQGAAGY